MSPTGVLICCTVPSEAVPFVCLASVCRSLRCLISALTQAGGGGLLFRLLVPSRCGEDGRCFPVYAAQAPGCSLWSGPCAARFQPSGAPRKRGLGGTCVLCLPRPSGSGSQELDGRLLPSAVPASASTRASRVHVPSPLRVPSPSPRRSGACALCLAATLPADVAHPESQEVFD